MTIQIPNFHVSDQCKIVGSGQVTLKMRGNDDHSGVFSVRLDVGFNHAVNDYPAGAVIINVDLSDSFKGRAEATSIEQVNLFGKHTPTSVITGRCKVTLQETGTAPVGCRFWLLIADNETASEQGTADVVGFVVYDRNGNMVAYGTGPVRGDMAVSGDDL